MSRVFRDSKITGQILFIKQIVTARQSVPCRQPVGLLPEARRPGTMPSTPCSRSAIHGVSAAIPAGRRRDMDALSFHAFTSFSMYCLIHAVRAS